MGHCRRKRGPYRRMQLTGDGSTLPLGKDQGESPDTLSLCGIFLPRREVRVKRNSHSDEPVEGISLSPESSVATTAATSPEG